MANSIIEENIALIRKYHKHFSQGGMGKFNSAFQIISILELDKDPKVHDTSSQRRYSSDHEEFIKVERQNKSETVEEKILMKEQESEEELTEELIEDRRPSEAVCDLPDRNYLARIIKREGDQFIVDEFKELQEDIESLIRQEGLDDLQSNSSEFLGYRSSIRPKELKEKNNEYLLSNDDAPPEDSFGTIERQVVAFPQARVMFFWGVEFGSEDKTSSVFQDHLVLKEFLQEMEQKEEIPYQPSQTQTLSPGLNLQGSFSAGPLVIRNSDYRFLYFPNNEEEREFLNQLRLSETDHSQDECSYPKSPSNQAPEKTVFSENCEGKEHDKFRSFEIPLKKMMSTPPLYLLNELDIDQLDSKAGLVEFSTEKTREVKEEKINAVCIESEENPQLFVSKATKKKNRQVKKKEKKHAKQAADHPKMKKNSTVTESIDISEIQKGGNKAEEDSDEEKQLLFFINESKGNTEGKEPSGHQTGAQPKKDAIATKATNERPQEPQEEADKGSAVLKERTTVHTERLERSNSKNENESAAKEEEETTEKENIDQANDKKKKKRKKKKKKEAAELRLGPKLSSFQEQLLKAQSQEEQEARSPAKKASEELIQEKPEVAIAFQFAQQIREHARLGRDPIELVLGMLQRVDGCKVKGLKIELDADLKQENGLIRLIAEGENITSN
jgi:hypothetical protein